MRTWKYVLSALVLLPNLALADTVGVQFKGIRVVDFAEATYKAMLNKDYVVAPDVIGLDKTVTVSIKQIDKAKLPALLGSILATVGVSAKEVDGIIRLEKVADRPQPDGNLVPNAPVASSAPAVMGASEPEEFEVYRRKHRTVEYLQMVLRSAGIRIGAGGMGGVDQGNQAAGLAQDSIVITGSPERREKVLKLLAEIDCKPVVMNVRAALVEFTDTKEDSFSLGAILSLIGSKLTFGLNAGVTPSDNYARIKSGSIDAVLKAINGDSRFRFRTMPSIRLVDGQRGRLQVGSNVPVRGALTLTKDGTPLQSVEYKSTGVILTVQPQALDGHVVASVVQEVSSVAQTTTSNIDSSTFNTRQIEAYVDAEDGEVVMLAGLDEDSSSESKSGLSWLPFATSHTNNNRNTQLLVLLEFQRL